MSEFNEKNLLEISTMLKTATQNVEKVHKSGYTVGHTEGYDEGRKAFWDLYQEKGERKDYSGAFYGSGWTDETFTPKYHIIPSSADCANIFRANSITNLKKTLEDASLTLDLSECTGFDYAFYNCRSQALPLIDLSRAKYTQYAFAYSDKLQELSLKVSEKTVFDESTFYNLCNLKILDIEGVIGYSISLKSSTGLQKKSITNLLKSLSDNAVGKTLELSKDAVDNAFPGTFEVYLDADTIGNVVSGNAADNKDKLNPSTIYRTKATVGGTDGEMPYVTLTTFDSPGQLIWNRSAGGYGCEKYTIDIGDARYLIIKARMIGSGNGYVQLRYSTNDNDSGWDGRLNLPIAPVAAENAEWVTLGVDLNQAFKGYHNKAEDAESYLMKVFSLNIYNFNAAGNTLDIAYMAFVKGDWENIEGVVDQEKVVMVERDSGTTSRCEEFSVESNQGETGNADCVKNGEWKRLVGSKSNWKIILE